MRRAVLWDFGLGHHSDGDRDACGLGLVEVLPDERKNTTEAFLDRALGFFAARGVRPRRLLSDNGSAYRSRITRRLHRPHSALGGEPPASRVNNLVGTND